MSILKRLAKKKPKMDLRKMSQVIANINSLIEMKLLKVDLSERRFYIQPVLWENKDQVFKDNWSRAVAIYWNAATGNSEKDGLFKIYNIESMDLITEYNLTGRI